MYFNFLRTGRPVHHVDLTLDKFTAVVLSQLLFDSNGNRNIWNEENWNCLLNKKIITMITSLYIMQVFSISNTRHSSVLAIKGKQQGNLRMNEHRRPYPTMKTD